MSLYIFTLSRNCFCSLQISLSYALSSLKAPYYGSYTYPAWAIGFGWFLAVLPLMPVPVCFGIAIYKEKGSLLEVGLSLGYP